MKKIVKNARLAYAKDILKAILHLSILWGRLGKAASVVARELPGDAA